MSLSIVQERGRRWYVNETGQRAMSVTAAVADIAFPDGDEWAGVPAALLRFHREEGTACHQAALNWIAHTHQFLPTFTLPEAPSWHPDPVRWANVMYFAVAGMQTWCERREAVPLAIEQPSANFRC